MMIKLKTITGFFIVNTSHVTAMSRLKNGEEFKSRIYVNGPACDSWFQSANTLEEIWDMMEEEALLQQRLRRPLWKTITDSLGITKT